MGDPATGAATAAFSGYLRDIGWLNLNELTLFQGDDMGTPSLIETVTSSEKGSPIKICGIVVKLSA